MFASLKKQKVSKVENLSMSEEKRRSSHTFRCTDEQWKVIEVAIKKSEKSASDFVVETLLDAVSRTTKLEHDNAFHHPMVLSPAMQEKMLRGILLLATLRQAELRNAGKDETLEELKSLVDGVISNE